MPYRGSYGRKTYGRRFAAAKPRQWAAKRTQYHKKSAVNSLQKLQHSAAREAYLNACPNELSPAGQLIAAKRKAAQDIHGKEVLTLGILAALAQRLGVIVDSPDSAKDTTDQSPKPSTEQEQQTLPTTTESEEDQDTDLNSSQDSASTQGTQDSPPTPTNSSGTQSTRLLKGADNSQQTELIVEDSSTDRPTWSVIRAANSASSSDKQGKVMGSQLSLVSPAAYLQLHGRLPPRK